VIIPAKIQLKETFIAILNSRGKKISLFYDISKSPGKKLKKKINSNSTFTKDKKSYEKEQ